jgi:hypothetical protein
MEKNLTQLDPNSIQRKISASILNGDEIVPFRIWDEMAETDILIEYMRKFMDSNINTLPRLRSVIFDSLYNYSTEVLPEVEQYYEEKLYLCLKHFLDKVALCQNQKQ